MGVFCGGDIAGSVSTSDDDSESVSDGDEEVTPDDCDSASSAAGSASSSATRSITSSFPLDEDSNPISDWTSWAKRVFLTREGREAACVALPEEVAGETLLRFLEGIDG